MVTVQDNIEEMKRQQNNIVEVSDILHVKSHVYKVEAEDLNIRIPNFDKIIKAVYPTLGSKIRQENKLTYENIKPLEVDFKLKFCPDSNGYLLYAEMSYQIETSEFCIKMKDISSPTCDDYLPNHNKS